MDLWERREDETDQAWRAFSLYRDAGLHRTFQAPGLPLADTLKLATKYEWAKRARAWDAWLEEARTTAFRDHSAELGKQAAEVACMGMTVAANGIRAILMRQLEGNGTAELASLATYTKLMVSSQQVGRLSAGQSTENVSINVADLTEEELALLRKAK